MCGIAGYFGTRALERATIDRCLERMRHRGPDHQAHVEFRNDAGRNAYLLAARLDIIDLAERSNQPLRVGDKTIAYNGEIYNYLEVREQLVERGRSFATSGDTEVLLTALDEHGTAALEQCDGMWAFVVYDEQTGGLTLSRDRFGEKPLYLYRDDTGIYFGSEAKFVFELLGRRLEPNLEHVTRYLVNGYKSLYKGRNTFFVGLEELQAASVLELNREGGERLSPYWDPLSVRPRDDMTYDEAVASIRERMTRTVELRLRADVPLAFAMSGGIDSLSLISIAKRVLGYDVHGFTILNEDDRYSEHDLIEHAVAELGVRHTALPTRTDGFLDKMRRIVVHHDAPVATISFFVHWLLMQSISGHGYRIAVSGIGGDELFSGYYDHHLAYLAEVQHDSELHARALAAWQEHVQPIVRNPYLSNPALFAERPEERAYVYLNADEFAAHLYRPWGEPFREESFVDDLLRNRMLNEVMHETIPVMLHEDDLNAMHFSIENRSPFLDPELFERAQRIPTRHLIRDGYAKAVLRDAMRGVVPDRILDSRRKVGFNAPILDVLDDGARAYLLDEDSAIYRHVRPEAIEAMLAKDFLLNSESKFLFNFLNAKLFLDEFGA